MMIVKADLLQLAAYPHLYSFTSTKSVVHWFQIIRNKSFQMYDDDVQTPVSLTASDRYYKVAKFPTRNIKTPTVLVYGGSDSLVDIKVMLKELPRHTVAKGIPHFEHLDFLWAQEVDSLVFPHVFEALAAYAGRDHHQLIDSAIGNRRSSIEGDARHPEMDASPQMRYGASDSASATRMDDARYGTISPSPIAQWKRMSLPQSSPSTDHTSLSSDDVVDETNHLEHPLKKSVKHSRKRSGSTSSLRSFDGAARFGEDGISIGASRATTGVANPYPLSKHVRKSSGAKQCKST